MLHGCPLLLQSPRGHFRSPSSLSCKFGIYCHRTSEAVPLAHTKKKAPYQSPPSTPPQHLEGNMQYLWLARRTPAPLHQLLPHPTHLECPQHQHRSHQEHQIAIGTITGAKHTNHYKINCDLSYSLEHVEGKERLHLQPKNLLDAQNHTCSCCGFDALVSPCEKTEPLRGKKIMGPAFVWCNLNSMN